MKHNVYFGIALRIIMLFSVGMIMSFITPHLHGPLGDTPQQYCSRDLFDEEWNWSAAHYWFYWMCFFIFILSIINCIVWIIKIVNDNYKI